MNSLACWNCGSPLSDIPLPISRHSQCSSCFNDLHCCRLCKYHDPERTVYCLEDRADPPIQKENSNFCDYFSPSSKAFNAGGAIKSADSKAKLESLFGSSEEDSSSSDNDVIESKEEEAKRALNDLFKWGLQRDSVSKQFAISVRELNRDTSYSLIASLGDLLSGTCRTLYPA